MILWCCCARPLVLSVTGTALNRVSEVLAMPSPSRLFYGCEARHPRAHTFVVFHRKCRTRCRTGARAAGESTDSVNPDDAPPPAPAPGMPPTNSEQLQEASVIPTLALVVVSLLWATYGPCLRLIYQTPGTFFQYRCTAATTGRHAPRVTMFGRNIQVHQTRRRFRQ